MQTGILSLAVRGGFGVFPYPPAHEVFEGLHAFITVPDPFGEFIVQLSEQLLFNGEHFNFELTIFTGVFLLVVVFGNGKGELFCFSGGHAFQVR